ncbi:MAG TPA: hypothetical protein VGW37_00705 [Terriglobia bacterium]|nr:hypothetical protein [Terriglobia bacterium]
MNRTTELLLLVLLFAVSSIAQTTPGPAEANILPDHIQPARNVFAQPFLDTRDAFLFKDKAESILAVTQGFFLISDGIVTRTSVRHGSNEEINPAVRVLTGPFPTWNRMAPLGAVQEVVGIWLGTEMKRSRHRFFRRTWWIPQAVGIGGNLSGVAYGILTR